jgi:adenine-specific DNA-methyltransferase
MDDKQRTLGQFETPPDVADLLLGFCLSQPSDWLMDPSCGDGAFLQRADLWRQWLANSPRDVPDGRLWGVELDEDTAVTATAHLPQAKIITQNFFTLEPNHEFDALIGNPPYTRAEWIGRLHRQSGEQLALDLNNETGDQRLETNLQPTNLRSSKVVNYKGDEWII